ncbi:amino acid racemase [Glycomyces sp. NPDC046736]|uniref:aspartate/glutamate racemase family protein n=1 Tax=Glycomyces sp. NPDC046736 TaxID=3155615 RepID=UPI0033DEBB8F
MCTNTMHVVAETIENAIDVPFVHLVDAVAASARAGGPGTVGLLGTRFTMEMGFYAERMARHGIEVLVPAEAEREAVHEIIYGELTLGQVREASREVYREVMAGLASRGAAGIVFGCTEITLLVDGSDSPVPVFDSTRIHTERLVELALG